MDVNLLRSKYPRAFVPLVCGMIFILAQAFFLLNIEFPRTPNFDEFHYIPAAKQFLSLSENQNWEHPPLGKELMALGIGIFGDRPLGWRFMSTFFGALTAVGTLLWSLAVFRQLPIALWITALTLANQLLYVQARIGMLDTFMWAFLTGSLAAFCGAWWDRGTSKSPWGSPSLNRKLFVLAGLGFGLATACKWFAVVPWLLCVGLFGLVRLVQRFPLAPSTLAARGGLQDVPFVSKGVFNGITPGFAFMSLIWVPILAYFATFLPYLWVERIPAYTLPDLWAMQFKMWEGQQRVVTQHPYMSSWASWPWMLRPIWYAFDKEPSDPQFVRGVLLLGNPLIMWGGLLAVGATALTWLKTFSRQAFLISVFYFAMILCWAVIPRKVAFYYYYYPAGMTLSLALGFCFFHWFKKPLWRGLFLALSLVLFTYFFPILSGSKIPAGAFRLWMWFPGWI